MVNCRPRKIYGQWADGYVLDLHTTGSTYVGDDEFGHPQFETHRTELGELLFRLKYRSDESALAELACAAASFIRRWGIRPTTLVPVPPTHAYRRLQPVVRLAEDVGRQLGGPVLEGAIRKLKQFPQLKNVYDGEERRRLLEGAFCVSERGVHAQRVLLLDDLYRSGATMNAISAALLAAGASTVYAFAFTQTRRQL